MLAWAVYYYYALSSIPFDLRLYNIRTTANLADLLKIEGIVKPEDYIITLDFSEEIKDEYNTKEVHISVLVDRPKK